MRNIMVVDCKSTGINYIGDIVNRRYNPVVLQLKLVKGNEETEKKNLKHVIAIYLTNLILFMKKTLMRKLLKR